MVWAMKDLTEAVFQRINSFVYVPAPVVLYPGLQTEPPNSGMWLEPNMVPNENTDLVWDNNGCIVTQGLVQILVNFRPGQGVIEPTQLADSLINWFPKGLQLDNVRVQKTPWQTPVVVADASRLFIPVLIPYYGLT